MSGLKELGRNELAILLVRDDITDVNISAS
jgi:hypothetical protein